MRHICTSIVAMLVLAGTSLAATINVPADYTTIQAAVDAASNGDEILVAPGTYTGTGDQVVDMLGKAITLRASGTPEQTIIHGGGVRRGITCESGEDVNTIIDGFTITDGSFPAGGGIYCGGTFGGDSPPSSPTITGCTITNNTATASGGGGGGISCQRDSNPTIIGCTISGNTSHSVGGGISCESMAGEEVPTLTDCIIVANTATGNWTATGFGGGVWGSCRLTRCTIMHNTGADRGGGIYCTVGQVIVVEDCEVSNNDVLDGSGGGIYITQVGASLTMTGSTVCGNEPNQIEGDWDGWGNFVGEECPVVGGACCINESCSITTEIDCGGEWLGEGTNCDGNPCYVPPTGACCINESCSITTEIDCGGEWLGEGTNCDGNPCYVPPTGACCINESCSITTEIDCGGEWLGEGTNCDGNPCYVPPTGACCINESCSITTEIDCGGEWLGEGTNCDGNPCYVPPTGACCINESCSITTEIDCGGEWLGEGGSCDDCTPDCPDVSGDGFVAVHDLLAVLEAWGSDDPDADVDGDGLVGMDDLEAVIANWGPCP